MIIKFESRKPPVATTGIIGWLRINLFSNWFNTIVTLFCIFSLSNNTLVFRLDNL